VHAFAESIGLRIPVVVSTGWILLMLRALIGKLYQQIQSLRIASKPLILKVHCNMLGCFIVKADSFRDGCTSINDFQSMEAKLTKVRNGYLPRSHKLNCNFFPWQINVILLRKMT
jgi:hypothetical protein